MLVFALSTLTGWHVLLANAIDNAAVVIVLANIIVCAFTCLCLLPFSKYVAAFLGKIGKDKENSLKNKDVSIVLKKHVYTGENVGEDEKSIAYSLTFMDAKKTLTEEEVTDIFEKIIEMVESKCEVKLRG